MYTLSALLGETQNEARFHCCTPVRLENDIRCRQNLQLSSGLNINHDKHLLEKQHNHL